MSSTNTAGPTNTNEPRSTGTRRSFFTRAGTPISARTTKALPVSITEASPASTTEARPVSRTRARSAGATANLINPSQTIPTSTSSGTQTNPNNALRQRMTEELSMFGLAPRSQQTYLAAVDRLASRSWKSVEHLSEDDIRQYMLNLRDNGAAQGTFKTNWFGLQFLYEHVLGREWALFTKKRFANPDKVASPMSVLTSRCNAS